MSNPLSLIISQFPKHEETIRILYLIDEDFRTLCEDYYTSKMHMDKYKDKITADRQWEKEYQHLASTLEKEIIEYIGNRE